MNYKVIVILGTTSSGKSKLAIKLAKDFNGEIISVDSRQVFEEMNLGTGKIKGRWKDSIYSYKNVPHHLIDFVNPEKDYNVSHFKKDCEEKIFQISRKGKIPILCGGTGFWIQAVIDNTVFPRVKPNLKLRQELKEKTTQELFEILEKLDPKRASTIDKKNGIRLIRAIEIAKKLGKVPPTKINQKLSVRKIKGFSFEFLQIGISVEREKLTQKIQTRLKERFEDGMIEEIIALYKKYNLNQKKIQNLGIAYSLVPLYEEDKITRKELFDQIVKAEKKYAKRQNTWFKKDPRIFWSDNYLTIKDKIRS